MKKIAKLIAAIAFSALIVSVTACSNNTDDDGENPYLAKNTLTVSDQQVWKRNREATKISQAYLEYSINHGINAFVAMPVAGEQYFGKIPVGSGNIAGGKLNFVVPALDENAHLLNWDYFKDFFSRYWKNVKVNNESTNAEIKGNMILLESLDAYNDPDGMLDRQGIFGTNVSLDCETILYFYVNKDCRITGEKNNFYIDGQYFFETEGDLSLSFKEGWNLVWRKELYGIFVSGHATIDMEIKNPIRNPENYRWVMEPGFVF